jgi:hypothetical protein
VRFFSTASISNRIATRHAASLGLRERPRLAIVARKMQLRLQIVRDQSWHRPVAEKVLHRTIPQRLVIVVYVDALLVVGEQSSELHRVVLDTS